MDVFTLIGSYGFPITVTIYLLWERSQITRRMEKTIRVDLSGSIQKLTEEIIRFSERCNGGKKL